MNIKAIKELKEAIKSSKCITILTGAGVSAESGIPTFRGEDGLWKQYRAEELATPKAFKENPALVWEWYNWRREIIGKAKPNTTHYAIAKLEEISDDFLLITQNIDGLHKLAGSKNIVEIHGNIWETRCTKCEKIKEDRRIPIPILPYCECGGLLRPNVVWFGESIPSSHIEKALSYLKKTNLFISIGTSSLVQPSASFMLIAKEHSAICAEINLEETPNSHLADIKIYGKAGKILEKLLEIL
jgi:NAD-dependent deacetylase